VLQFDSADPRIKSGMTANVSITTDEKEGVISVPQGLLVRRDGKVYVRIITGGMVQEREVRLGGVSSLGEVEILNGLVQGDVIVTSLP
jgi:HlyD family secretion protein